MSKRQPFVMMKGKKDGLVFVMDEMCSYEELVRELRDKLALNQKHYQDGPLTSVKVQVGNRYLSPSQKDELAGIIHSYENLFVADIESNVLTRKEYDETASRRQLVQIRRIVRSGQVLNVKGDLFLIGDVNPGGVVSATGNIYIMGALRGIAHAGVSGKEQEAIIAASVMKPTQLKIGRFISRTEEEPGGELKNDHLMECAYVDLSLSQIMIDRLQTVCKNNRVSKMPAKL